MVNVGELFSHEARWQAIISCYVVEMRFTDFGLMALEYQKMTTIM